MFAIFLAVGLSSVVLGDGQVPCQIPGPRVLTDRVAIVGAGAAGIHMALRLKEKGFSRVTVFEQSGSVGGDDYYESHRGTIFPYPARVGPLQTILKSLMDKYAASDLIRLSPSNKWTSIRNSNNQLESLTRHQYLLERGKKFLNNQNETVVKILIINTLNSYINIHNSYLSSSSCSFTNEPKWNLGKKETEGTFRDFLQRFNLRLLDPLFEEATLLGHGYMDEISATYGLFMFGTTFANQMIQFINQTAPVDFVDYAIKNGERQLWQAIANNQGLTVQLNSAVDRLRRDSLTEKTPVHLRINGQWRTFDFVIWTANMKKAIQQYWSWKRPEFNAGPSHEEYQNFLRMDQDVNLMYQTNFLFDSELMGRGGSYIDDFPDDVQNKKNGIYQMYDTYAINDGQTNTILYQGRLYPRQNVDGSEFRTVMGVSFHMSSSASIDFNKVQSLFNPRNVTYYRQSTQQIFPRYSNNDQTNGIMWRVLAMQGKYGVWYTGRSVYINDVNMVLQYNEVLLNKMRTPSTGDNNKIN